jgi:hypothetical protein
MTDAVVPWRKRIERAQETRDAVAKVQADPSPENIAALHRLHAAHLREGGDLGGAEQAEARAKRVEAKVERPESGSERLLRPSI